MKFHPGFLALLTLVSFLLPEGLAEARSRHRRPARSVASPTPPSCDEAPVPGARSIVVPQFTGYAPALGGVNGSCGGGASRALGFAACRDTLQKFVKGKAPFIHAAAQQRGGSADLFGCWAKTTDAFTKRGIASAPGKTCHLLAVMDHYAWSENAGRRGINGRQTGTKMDIEVDKLDVNYRKLGTRVNGNISCIKRVTGTQNRDKPKPRKIRRRYR